MVGTAYGPHFLAKIHELDWHWHWFGSVVFHYGEALSLLPGVILTALLAPRVAYRRRDALTLLFFPPAGIRVAWIIGTRLGQLPHRPWPERTGGIELQGRQVARIAVGVNRYRLWRQRRTGKETAVVESAPSCHTHVTAQDPVKCP
jgi:hypothetical protein